MRPSLLLLPLLVACTSKAPKDPPGGTAPPGDTSRPFDTGVYDRVHGKRPAEFLEAPEFEVTASNGELRRREHLLDHPTVMWFYPMASTSG